MFFPVRPAECHYYQAPEKFYGNTTFDTFPDSEDDLRSAARMVAFGEWTACVFYHERGVELALQKWAEQLNLDLQRGRIVDANWSDILRAADRKMKEIENSPKD